MTNREIITVFLKGLAASTLFFVVLMGALSLFVDGGNKESSSGEKFRVVDKYGPCDVVRYTPKGEAKFVYFLDCK
jgi:hypothetical protein